jgi:hypothetical protein
MTTNEAVAAAYLAMISCIGFEVCVLMIWHGLGRLGDRLLLWVRSQRTTDNRQKLGNAYIKPAYVCAKCGYKGYVAKYAVHGLEGRRFCSPQCRNNYVDTTRKYSLKYRKYVHSTATDPTPYRRPRL